jgi:hypothetical protein
VESAAEEGRSQEESAAEERRSQELVGERDKDHQEAKRDHPMGGMWEAQGQELQEE